MELIGRIFGGIFDAYLAVFGALSPGASLTVMSLLLGVLMLLAFKWVGDPKELETSRHRMQAFLMEMRLFDQEPKIVFGSMGRLFWWNLRFFVASLRPAVIATIPMVLLFVQMEHYYGRRPLRDGESAVVTAKLRHFEKSSQNVQLESSPGVAVETPPVRSPKRELVSWRIRADAGTNELSEATLTLVLGKAEVTKSVTTGVGRTRVSMRRVSTVPDLTLYPVESAIEANNVLWVDVAYPSIDVAIFGLELHWLIWLVLISVIGAFGIRWGVNAWRPNTL